MKTVTIYSTPLCQYCKMAKAYFKENDIKYTEHDVAGDEVKAKEMVEKTGQMAVPVITIEDEGKEEVIIGFDRPKIADLLGLAS
jgi:glutaredoxin 3